MVPENVLGAVIDVEVIVAKEPNKNNVEVFGDPHGETRWSTDTRDHRDSTHDSFLQEFEACTSGEQKQGMAQGSAVREKLRTDELVDRVVTAYVFFNSEEFAF